MTEDEAKVKFCLQHPPTSNMGYFCAASKCMGWRWTPITMTDEHIAAVKKAAIDLDDKSASRSKAARDVADFPEKYGLPTKPFRGFCGLAGKP